MKKHIKIIAFLSPILCFIVIWVSSLVKCEMLTALYYDNFMTFDEVSEAETFKILSFDDYFARIYCVTTNFESGSVHDFTKKNNEWEYDKWEDGGWSASGSADRVIWPYWWHVIYFWF